MFKKLLTISLALLVLSSMMYAQNKRVVLKPNGKQIKLDSSIDLKEAIKVSNFSKGKEVRFANKTGKDINDIESAGLLDTLSYADLGVYNTNFGFFGYDVMIQYFEAPADLTIKAAGFAVSDDSAAAAGGTFSVRLIKLNWTLDELKDVPAPFYMGFYPSDNDGAGNADPFGEEATGSWQDSSGSTAQNPPGYSYPLPPWTDNADPGANNWNYDLWSDAGFGWPISPETSTGGGDYLNWVEMINLGFEPQVLKGEVFAVAVINDVPVPNDDEANRIGFFSDNTLGIPAWKYYEMGRATDGVNPGWWARQYTWDFAVAVDITGDLPPTIEDMTILPTTLSTDARTVSATVTDTNPGGGNSGLASVELVYTIDGGDEVRVNMAANGDVYSADIPGQSPGTEVTYWIEAEDVEGNTAVSGVAPTYTIFAIENPNALLIFNGFDSPSGYPQSYYFGVGDFANYSVLDWDHDVWAYGSVTAELLDGYKNIVEITTNGPSFDNSALIRAWIEADGTRNYLAAGDEYLGALFYGWPGASAPVTTLEGEFAHDILGVATYYSDIVSTSIDVNVVHPVEGSALGGPLFDLYTQVSTDSGWTADMNYDPQYEISTSIPNWLDGVDFAGDVEVDMMGVSLDPSTLGNEYSIGGHRELAAGNKIAFLSYDPISLNSDDAGGHAQYYWYGFTYEAPQVQALDWFGALVVGLGDDVNGIVSDYELGQNYPNPFNPSTKIAFSVPKQGNVTLKVYNLLGQEVATLLNEVKTAGVHEVSFNGIDLSSGVYFYTLTSGDFVSTKKMMLIK
jgi:hypothetical protein